MIDSHDMDSCLTDGSLALKQAPASSHGFAVYEGGKGARAARMDGAETSVSRAGSSRATIRMAAAACCIVAALFAGLFGLQGMQMQDRASRLSEAPRQSYVIQSGDSIWSLAEAHPVSGVSTQDLASYIQSSNGLANASLQPGETIEIPA